MALTEFDVIGKAEYVGDTDEIVREADPSRSLVRYRADGSEIFVDIRVNPRLLAEATSLPVLLLEPTQRPDEVVPGGELLTALGSVRNYELLERICHDLDVEACPARYLAEQAGRGRRDFFFVTEDVDRLEQIAHRAAAALEFPLAIRVLRLADIAPTILPTEFIGELGLPIPPDERMRTTRFEFWGSGPSLERLRHELERLDFHFVGVELATSELRMVKEVPIDGPDFLGVLRAIVPLARSLRCSYRGTETVGGFEQFALTRPLPPRYTGTGDGREGTERQVVRQVQEVSEGALWTNSRPRAPAYGDGPTDNRRASFRCEEPCRSIGHRRQR
jgi:hypothetical protein